MQDNLHHAKQPANELPEYNLLAPIAINRVLDEQAVNTYIERLRSYYDGARGEAPRPALGYEGLKNVQDTFIEKMLESEDVLQVNQTPWLFQHGGMRIPSEELFDEVYVKEIWKRLREQSRFGLYE